MQNKITYAAIAAMLCACTPLVVHGQSNNEIFAPGAASLFFFDGADATTGSYSGIGYEVIKGYAVAEGDMVLGPVDRQGNVLDSAKRGLGQSRFLDRWTNGIIPYQFNTGISQEERDLAEQAIAHWNQYTSITLVELTDENRAEFENYISFEASNGCASYVGMRGGEQQLWISASCGVGSIIHELGHAVGLFHEHTRNDRDNYINVQWENIVQGKEFNFDILNSNATLLGEYDYGSIMHYGENFFSSNSNATITVLDGSSIGQRDALSDKDIQSANSLYETDLSLLVNSQNDFAGGTISADIQVTNLGEMGTHELTLTLELPTAADWLSMSPNSGWDCAANGSTLACSRETLDTSATSIFTLIATANGASAEALTGELLAKTRETDYENNGHNRAVTAPPVLSASTPANSGDSSGEDLEPQEPSQNDPNNSNGTPSDPGAALPESSDDKENVITPTTNGNMDSSNKGGALSPYSGFLLLLTSVALSRRRS